MRAGGQGIDTGSWNMEDKLNADDAGGNEQVYADIVRHITQKELERYQREAQQSQWAPGKTQWVYTPSGKSASIPKVDPIESAADVDLIMELIKRGYAVAKLPVEELAESVGVRS